MDSRMIVFRLLGLLLIVLALMLLGADVVSTLEKNGEIVIRSLDHILLLLRVESLPWFERTLGPQFAYGMGIVFSWPAWAVLGVPGVLLGMLAANPRQRRSSRPPPISR
jgi:hypothetical protein